MRFTKASLAAALITATLGLPVAATAQDMHHDHGTMDHAAMRHDEHRMDRHHGWGRHDGWGHRGWHRNCWTRWHHHHAVRVCR